MISDKFHLWGAGTYGARTIEFMKDDLSFLAVIDNDVNKIGTTFHGVPVISSEEAFQSIQTTKLVIALNIPTEVRELLLVKGLAENKDFFTLHDFIPRYYWSKNKTLVVKSVDFAVTTMCNMKCISCQTQIPIVKNRRHLDVDSILNDLDMLFSHVDKVMTLNICCGESFLNKKLPDICTSIYKKYQDRYHTLLVQANGTIIPNDGVMRSFSKSKTIIVTSNYPENERTTNRLIDKCNEFDIKWYINRSGNRDYWYDLGDPRIISETNPEKLSIRFEKCWKPGMGLNDGWLYICASQLWANVVAEEGEIEQGDAFDLRQEKTETSKESLLQTLSRLPPEKGYISHCMRCNSVMTPYKPTGDLL